MTINGYGDASTTLTITDTTPRLDIDSNNDSGFTPDPHEPGDAEDQIEDDPTQPGKIIAVNDGDSDGDGIPDYADGFAMPTAGPDGKWSLGAGKLVPVSITIPAGVSLLGATFKIVYDANDPLDGGVISPVDADDTWSVGTGSLRLWKSQTASLIRDAHDVATPGGQFIKSDTAYTAALLGITPGDYVTSSKTLRTITLWAEAINGSAQLADISTALTSALGASMAFAAVDQARLSALIFRVAVDGNRDSQVSYATSDHTSVSNPYRFWINDDRDDDSEDVPVGTDGTDGADHVIRNTRDLEDFAPLKLGYSTLLTPDLVDQISFEFESTAGTPAIRLWSVDGSLANLDDYLVDHSRAQQIVDLEGDSSHFRRVDAGDPHITSWPSFSADFGSQVEVPGITTSPVIWEGVNEGEGALIVKLLKAGQVIASARVDLSIEPIKKFYETWTVADGLTPVGDTFEYLPANHRYLCAGSFPFPAN